MSRLLIGVPARNEAEGIVALVNRLEDGVDSLGTAYECELALAYQPSDDDTLARFVARPNRVPQVVLHARGAMFGKGANVKRLIEHAIADRDDYLLLVDADFVDYAPSNLAHTLDAARRAGPGLVLPLWSRPQGQGNTTNYLVSPLLFATHRARIRQPIAGHMLLHRSLLDQLDVDGLPDDFGVDVSITLAALSTGVPIAQVPLLPPDHPSKTGNSERVMVQVTSALLRALVESPTADRPDVAWPERYWEGWDWPRNLGIDPDHVDVILRHASSEAEFERWLAVGDAGEDAVAELWCDVLADAVRRARSPHPDFDRIVADLVCPFFVHAEFRARHTRSVRELEEHVADLGLRLAARLHG